ncbi:uncharacterized protein LOC100905481 [Galendromus occidentalis]|uniref:Uncharacterized protein LOC100905481 n=1 Tax=Galendromus occidentalis TaxID=34638 RepID=A0AAJ6QT79_9ACAR|nr:uncharacterized protein LOC100905481 [Galendromus occidentalis]
MKILLLVASVVAVSYGHSPVLLWPAEEFKIPETHSVLDMMDVEDFQKLFEGKKIVVFHKRTFNLEEVSYPKKPLTYLRNVDAIALQGVKSIHRFVGGLTSSDNLKFVRLSDGDVDEQQEEIEKAMKANPGFAAVLVGSGSHRSRRQAESDTFACRTDNDAICMAYVGAIKIKAEKETEGKCSIICNENDTIVTIEGEATAIKLSVSVDANKDGYSLNVDNKAYRVDSDTTWAPMDFSYSCGSLVLAPKPRKKGPIITLKKFQVYPRSVKDKDGKPTGIFPDSYDCATWFTPALWMGTSVALFYIFLLFGAVIFLLDVKTNDRFDDPKGKTITVNVAE